MKCFIETLIRPPATFSHVTVGEGKARALPSPAVKRERGVAIATRVRAWMLLFASVLSGQFASACPLCKEALTQGMAKGFFWSILLMLSMPLIVVGVIAGVIWRAERRKPTPPGVLHE